MNLPITKEQYIAMRQAGASKEQILSKFSQGDKTTISDVADKVTDFTGFRGVADALGTGIAASRTDNPDELQNIVDSAPSNKQALGSVLQGSSMFLPVGGMASGITSGARALGMKTGASALGKIGAGAAAGYAFDVGANMQNEGTPPGKPGIGTALGAGFPAAGVAMNVLGRNVAKVAPKLLSYTSDVPEKAFEEMLKRREPVRAAIQAGTTPEMALADTQGAVRQLRTTLSNEWQESVSAIIKEQTGKRMNISGTLATRLDDIADDFGLTLPQNTKNVSVKESLELLKQINELPRGVLTFSPKGAVVRSVKKELQEKVIETFGGKGGSVEKLYANYASKKGVLDAANDIVKAYSTGKPIQQSTALGRLQSLFSENKSAYFNAILDLEKTTGKDLISKITASQFGSKLPKGTSMATASGTLRQSKSALDKAIDLLILPLSSPRSAAFIARALSKVKSPALRAPGDILLESRAGQRIVQDLKEAQPGMSIKDVSGGKPSTGTKSSKLSTDTNTSISNVPTERGGVSAPKTDTSVPFKDTAIPKELQSLAAEAKKYKTAEEFVRKQPLVYHGSQTPLQSFHNDNGAFFTDDMMNADGYGSGENVYEGYLNLNKPLIIDAKGAKWDELASPYGKSTVDVVANVDSNKYDGVIFKNIKDSWIDDADFQDPGTIFYAFKPADSFMNESQLTDLWNKANGK